MPKPKPDSPPQEDVSLAGVRRQMVDRQLRRRGLRDERVLSAVASVPRHRFVPTTYRSAAYEDRPLPIGFEQTISQPYTVAFMSAALELRGPERVLEIGTGSGYGAAVLSRLAREVHSIERISELAERARGVLGDLQYDNVHVHTGDGSLGLPEHAPYDAIVVTAGATSLPAAFLEQLSANARIVIPIGGVPRSQTMRRFTRVGGELRVENLGGFAFVPLVGAFGWDEDD